MSDEVVVTIDLRAVRNLRLAGNVRIDQSGVEHDALDEEWSHPPGLIAWVAVAVDGRIVDISGHSKITQALLDRHHKYAYDALPLPVEFNVWARHEGDADAKRDRTQQGKQARQRLLEDLGQVSAIKPGDIGVLLNQEISGGVSLIYDETASDISAIKNDAGLSETERLALIKARLGQGQFRQDVIANWGGRCAVTHLDLVEILRALHIKPWRSCSNSERLDPYNGLLLCPNMDALFDLGLISFESSGDMIVSPQLAKAQQQELGVPGSLCRPLSDDNERYMQFHRKCRFRSSHP